MLREKYIGVVALLAVGFFYGLSGMLAKYVTLFASPLQTVEIRFSIALLLILLFVLLFRRTISFRGLNRVVLLLYILAFPACVVLFTLSLFHGTVALATASAYGAALVFSFLLSRIFFAERVDFLKGIAFLLTLLALFVFTEPWRDFTVSFGLLLGVLSGALQGVSNAVQKKLNQSGADYSSLLLLQCFAGALLGALVVLFAGQEVVFVPEANPFLLLLYGGSSLATVYLFLVGFKYIEINTGSILVSSQLFFGPALAWIFLQEEVSLHLLIGGILVLLAGILANWPRKSQRRS